MGQVTVCDATGAMVPDGEERLAPWGWPRTYSREGMKAVDDYTRALMEAAMEARKLFHEKRNEAREAFRAIYPEGKLPDEAIEP